MPRRFPGLCLLASECSTLELVFLGWMDDGLSGLGGNPWMYKSANWKVRHVNRKINEFFFFIVTRESFEEL